MTASLKFFTPPRPYKIKRFQHASIQIDQSELCRAGDWEACALEFDWTSPVNLLCVPPLCGMEYHLCFNVKTCEYHIVIEDSATSALREVYDPLWDSYSSERIAAYDNTYATNLCCLLLKRSAIIEFEPTDPVGDNYHLSWWWNDDIATWIPGRDPNEDEDEDTRYIDFMPDAQWLYRNDQIYGRLIDRVFPQENAQPWQWDVMRQEAHFNNIFAQLAKTLYDITVPQAELLNRATAERLMPHIAYIEQMTASVLQCETLQIPASTARIHPGFNIDVFIDNYPDYQMGGND